jgi:hypothetical protein
MRALFEPHAGEALLGWVEQEDDLFEKRLREDVAVGKLDKLIAEAIAEDEAGETIDLETSCERALLEAVR